MRFENFPANPMDNFSTDPSLNFLLIIVSCRKLQNLTINLQNWEKNLTFNR